MVSMELKVWCEGMQRVICGVTELTTCQDVVIALAQAMGKTGRYTLIEKWRDSERFISPGESPVLSLSKWGEYANEVQFILRLSGSRTKSSPNGDILDSNRSKLSPHNFSSHQSGSRSSSTSSLRKSLTFSGAHSRSHLVPNNVIQSRKREKNGSLNDNSSMESLTERSSQSSHSTFMHSSPYSSIEHSQRIRNLGVSQSGSSLNNKTGSSLGQHPSPHGNVPFSYTGSGTHFGSLERTRKRDTSSYNHSRQLSDTSPSSSANHQSANAIQPPRQIPRSSPLRNGPIRSSPLWNSPSPTSSLRDRPSPFMHDRKPVPRETNNNIDFKTSLNSSKASTAVNNSKQDLDTEAAKKAELLKLVNSQMEKLQQQEDELRKIDTEISLVQHFDHDVSEKDSVSQEITRLKNLDLEIDNEIQDLELVAWDGKLELETEKSKRLRSELDLTQTKLKTCTEQLSEMEQKLKEFSDMLSSHKSALLSARRQEKESEMKVVTEISDLQKQILSNREKHEHQQQSIDDLENKVKSVESQISEKRLQISQLEHDVKQSNLENLETLSRLPTEQLDSSQDGHSIFSRSTPTRPGSARLFDSPQRLKDALLSTKNPNGLWV